MNELILHHYDTSPFSEKVRLIFGFKGLAWRSVKVPPIMPKPDAVALTGGYRKTPFMQIGADVYCDTALMCRVIDQMHPTPPLYPTESAGLASILAQWADSALFWVAVPSSIQRGGPAHYFPKVSPEFLQAFAADRAAMTQGMRRPALHDMVAHAEQYFAWLEQLLGDGRAYLAGAAPSIADFSVAQSLWFMQRAPNVAATLAVYPMLSAWFPRVLAFGHGQGTEMSSTEALAVSAAASGHAPCRVVDGAGFAAGDAVVVNALDYGADPVAGALVGLDGQEIVVARHDERAGKVHVHFPRIGFQIKKEKVA